jgi:hypothetical protein
MKVGHRIVSDFMHLRAVRMTEDASDVGQSALSCRRVRAWEGVIMIGTHIRFGYYYSCIQSALTHLKEIHIQSPGLRSTGVIVVVTWS